MPKTEPLLGLVLLGLAGCGSLVAPQKVSVNLSRVIIREKPVWANPPVQPNLAPGKTVQVRGSVPPKRAEVVHLTDDPERKRQLEATLRATREGSQTRLERRLRDAYLAELNKTIPDLERVLALQYSDAYDQLLLNSNGAFQQYAEERGKLWARYLLVARTPDRGDRRYRAVGFIEPRDAEAKILKAELDAFDARYRGQVQIELEKVDQANRERLLVMRAAIEKRRSELIAQAETEAATQIQARLVDLDETLDAAKPITLPAAKGVSVSGQMQAAPPPLRPIPTALLSGEEMARRDAVLWGKVSGFEVVFDNSAPDKSEDFIQWRKRKLGL